jgi:hypothetical protein
MKWFWEDMSTKVLAEQGKLGLLGLAELVGLLVGLEALLVGLKALLVGLGVEELEIVEEEQEQCE